MNLRAGYRTQVPVLGILLLAVWYLVMFRWQSTWWRTEVRNVWRARLKDEERWLYDTIRNNELFILGTTYFSFLPAFLASMLAVTLGSKAPWLSYRLKVPLTGFYWMLILFVIMQVAWVVTREWRDAERKQTPGFMAMFNMQLILLPISRTSPLLRWFKLDPADALAYHRHLGWLMTIFTVVHTWMYCWYWYHNEGLASIYPHLISWEGKYPTLPGTLAFIALVAMIVTAIEPVRRKYYQVFFQVHRVTGVLIFFFFSAHYPAGFWIVLCNVIIYMSDRATEMQTWLMPAPLRSARYSAGVLTVRVASAQQAEPCQWVQVQAPKLSQLEQHPFSIVASGKDYIVLCLKVNPDAWTDRLVKDIFDRNTKSLRVSDFYGASFELENFTDEPLCLFAGGSGITSFSALLQHFSRMGGLKTKEGNDNPVMLTWVCKNKEELNELMRGVCLEETLASSPNLTVNLYVTGTREIDVSGAMEVNFEEETPKRSRRWVLEWLSHLLVPICAILVGGPPTYWDRSKANGWYVSAPLLGGALLGALLAYLLSAAINCAFPPQRLDLRVVEMGTADSSFSRKDETVVASEFGKRLEWHVGRPDIGTIMEDMAKQCGVQNLLVLASGPPVLNAAVKQEAYNRGHGYEEFTFEM